MRLRRHFSRPLAGGAAARVLAVRLGLAHAALLAAAAAGIPASAAAETLARVSEVKLAILAHDVGFAGGKEGGADINGELLLASPIDDKTAARVPACLRWLVQPRFHLGFEANTSGYTSQGYFGLTWTWLLVRRLVSPEDGLDFAISFGPSFNNGFDQTRRADRKSLGAPVLFRESFELGYRIARRWEVSLFFDHVSNGGLAKYNQSINNAGLRLGYRF